MNTAGAALFAADDLTGWNAGCIEAPNREGIAVMTEEIVFYHDPRSRAQMVHGMLSTRPALRRTAGS